MSRILYCTLLLLAVNSAGMVAYAADGAEAAPPASQLTGELAIRTALSQKAAVDFVETPLVDVLAFIGEKFNVQVFIDRRGLSEAGIAADSPVSLKVSNIPLKSVLGMVLEQVPGTTWCIRHELLQFTSEAKASAQLSTKSYDVRELLGDETATDMDARKLSDLILTHVAPDSWQSNGGNGAVTVAGTKHPVLVVTQSWQNHEVISELFTQLKVPGKAKPAASK